MAVPSVITDLSTTAASNSPAGSDVIGTSHDDFMRAHAAFIAQLNATSIHWGGTGGGTVDAITITPSPAITAYATGQVFAFISSGANTSTTPTINVNGIGAKTIKKNGATALAAGDIQSGASVICIYDGTNVQLVGVQNSSGANGDVQTFDASGTWTKPSGGTMALIEVWGAGGGGARRSSGNAGGGAGGGYTLLWKKLSDLGATETVTIGSGGAAQSTDNTNGNNGGTTSFGSHVSHVGGSGGEQVASGFAYCSMPGGVGAVQGGYATSTSRCGANSAGYIAPALVVPIGTAGVSGASWAATDAGANSGAPSFMGGSNGGSMSTVGATAQSNGGTSVYGGAGGNGNKAGAGSAGAQPGGGGGAGTTQGGAGGDGRVKVSVF